MFFRHCQLSLLYLLLARRKGPIATKGSAREAVSLGVHSHSLERETSTGVLGNFSRESASFKRELANLRRTFAEFRRFSFSLKPINPGFGQLSLHSKSQEFMYYNSKANKRTYQHRILFGRVFGIALLRGSHEIMRLDCESQDSEPLRTHLL